jgi:hypothetical protein
VVALRLLLAVFLTPTCEPEALSQTKDASPAQQSQEAGASAAGPVIKAKVNELLEQADGAAARPARDRGSFPGFFTPTSAAATMQWEILYIAARSNMIIDTMKPRVHHSLKVRVSERGLSVQAREGYSAPAPEKHKH